MVKYTYLNTNIYIEEGTLDELRLLQSNKAKLSTFRSNEGSVRCITNASFFANDYVLGRNQGDEYQGTYANEHNGKWCDFVIDNGYHAGKFNSWDYPKSVCGYSPASILILDGKDVELYSTPLSSAESIIKTKNPRTALAITKDKKVLLICNEGRINGNGLTGQELKTFLKGKYDLEYLGLNDGGGSAEMIVNGTIVNKLSDGSERAMFNGLAFVSTKTNIPTPEKPTTNTKKLFVPRFSKDGMKGNKYWYSNEFNAGYTGISSLPNCVTYASGRSSEMSGVNCRNIMKNRTGFGDAKDWYNETIWEKGSSPKVGAIAVWTGTTGHVAIVEDYYTDGTIKVSQSNYQASKDYNSPNYFQVATYKPVVGQITTGVGLKFLGYIYNPYITMGTSKRDTSKDQVEVLYDLLRVRKTPNGEWLEGRYAPVGLFDILETQKAGNYTWAKIADGTWFALNDEEEWTVTYFANKEETPTVPDTSLEDEIKRLKEDNLLLAKDIEALANERDSLNKKLGEMEITNNELYLKLEKIREVIN